MAENTPIERHALILWLSTSPLTKSIILESELIFHLHRKFSAKWKNKIEPVRLIKLFTKYSHTNFKVFVSYKNYVYFF